MQLTRDQVRHIAKLARIELSDAELEKYEKELSNILKYVEQLGEVNTDGVEPTAQVTGLKNVTRPDELAPLDAPPGELLACSKLYDSDEHQIKVPNVF